ncbi:hypothetical protein N0V87_003571 [Didymella glomerata]|uniref:Uncharacterized protein n=1 Tax=Didymella glomerata TaxID=749621 RepID=A0A9W8X204_9PLEO|nr:hypothetical protein N0V87_003571 [Didymella glomerata]
MPVTLNCDEAQLFHHFIRHLGRWLDCTNAARLFTLVVSEKATACPILVAAILCFSARHQGKRDQGEEAYERAITLLIDRLNESPARYDEMLLSAVLLLHFADQLSCTSSILRASMTLPFIDPSATSLRDAAFWIYVRQILYNSTISQEPLDIDFSLELMPTPELLVDKHPLAWLRSETAWANQCLWLTACVANFCFSGPKTTEDASTRAAAWQELWDRNQAWQKKRPKEFDAIGRGPARDGHVFEDVWFTADWHEILWMLKQFEEMHAWRTTWIADALKDEWGMG